jgi:predicted nucleotidyltransferase component of viral defense system
MESEQASMVTPVKPAWEVLFEHALVAIGEISRHGRADPFWTFGGGTALMLQYGHRLSKDIDIFVPDPQSLGFVTPRLSSVMEEITSDYVEAANYVKLFLPEGEIDFIAAPNLTFPGFEIRTVLGRQVKVETPAEIVVKKLWHRGDRITGRDIFDVALVARRERDELFRNKDFLIRHASALVEQINLRREPLRVQYEAIDALNYELKFDDAIVILRDFLAGLLGH